MLARIARQVALLEPGQSVEFDMRFLELHIAGYQHNGSAYGWSYRTDWPRLAIIFQRQADDGRRTYISPDRR